MSRAFYALTRPKQIAFRSAVVGMRDGRAPEAAREAWAALDIGEHALDRTHVLDLFDIAEERLALVPPGEREPIAAALLGGCP
ncbi:protein of unknown function [Methylorubrum extorquens]|uniref:Uncharacterized protein n=1 Tax=Methylorubrum extorquens TaxID=408 RepID=A0A2N9ANA8_METEX|nr:hypothetical protein ASF36_19060 [Methylobacterium sp. Leaf90]SOR28815.1 protein of unknown function [Methylorubrum extorquens]